MTFEVLFVGVAVRDFPMAVEWYDRFFGRSADVAPIPDQEVMWRVNDNGWLYVVDDAERAGSSLAVVAVDDLDAALAELSDRGITTDTIEEVGGGRKATFADPTGNSVALIQV
jgi:predicted enzyme related to lactoylglutathione lyase